MRRPSGRPRRAIAAAAALLCAVSAGSGCGERADRGADGQRRPDGGGGGRVGGTVAVGVAAGASTLLPPLAAAALDYELAGALFLGLNYAVWRDGRLEYPLPHPMALARSAETGPDGRTLTYRLDTRRLWSDGRPVRAADVAFTWELLRDPSLGLPLTAVTGRLDSIATPDDSTVVFHFARPYPGMWFDTGVGVIPEHVYGGFAREELQGLPGYREGASVVTSGPFTLDRWSPTDRIALRRVGDGAPAAGVERVVVLVMPDEAARVAALRAGELDAAQLTSHAAARRLAESGLRIELVPRRGYDYIAWNPKRHAAFRDVRVRRALALAIDREALLGALDMEGFAEPAHGPYGSLFPDLATPPPVGGSHDPAEARRLLDEAGWRDADGDGLRELAGVSLEFELATQAGSERREAAAEILQSQLAAVGARVRIRTQEFGALLERAQRREYEALLLGWQVALDPDISEFWYDADDPFNLTGYEDRTARALMDSALASPTAETAAPYWRRAGERIAGDQPYAFLWFFDLPWAVGPRLQGVRADPVGFAHAIHEWRLAGSSPGSR